MTGANTSHFMQHRTCNKCNNRLGSRALRQINANRDGVWGGGDIGEVTSGWWISRWKDIVLNYPELQALESIFTGAEKNDTHGGYTRLVQRRRRRQQERQKKKRFRLAKQEPCVCITFFLYISLPSLHDHDVKLPNFT